MGIVDRVLSRHVWATAKVVVDYSVFERDTQRIYGMQVGELIEPNPRFDTAEDWEILYPGVPFGPFTYTRQMAQSRTDEQHDLIRGYLEPVLDEIRAAIGRIDPWLGSTVLIAVEEFKRIRIYVGKGNRLDDPGMTVFVDGKQRGAVRDIDDVVEGGDPDFFDSPMAQADYFNLVNELRNPGSTRSKGNEVITLYTARPTSDRSTYERASAIPVNVFLTNDPDEAGGYAREFRDRDIWRIRIKRRWLVETLSAGRLRNYQAIAPSGKVPVEHIELVG